jgi:hypothetical protein
MDRRARSAGRRAFVYCDWERVLSSVGATARGCRFWSRGCWAEGPGVHPAQANGLGGQCDKTAAPGPTGQWFSKGERSARWADNASWRPRLPGALPSLLYALRGVTGRLARPERWSVGYKRHAALPSPPARCRRLRRRQRAGEILGWTGLV